MDGVVRVLGVLERVHGQSTHTKAGGTTHSHASCTSDTTYGASCGCRLPLLALGAAPLAAAFPDDEADDEAEENESSDKDVWPSAENLFFELRFLLCSRLRGMLTLRCGEKIPLRVACRILPVETHIDEVVVGGLDVS